MSLLLLFGAPAGSPSVTFTADAHVATRVVGTVPAASVPLFTVIGGGAVTADAVILVTSSQTFTADGIVFGTSTFTFTADAIVNAGVATQGTRTFTADAVVQQQGITTAFTADAVVSEASPGLATYTKTFTADGVINATPDATFASGSSFYSIVGQDLHFWAVQ